MPPKKAKKAAAAPTRRSARIASRETSLEVDNAPPTSTSPPRAPVAPVVATPPVDVILSPPQRSPSPPLTDVYKKYNDRPYTAIRRQFALDEIRQRGIELQKRKEEEEAKAKAAALVATPPKQLPSPPSPAAAAPPVTAPQQRVAPQQASWRRIISSVGGYLTSPFVRKRSAVAAEDEETEDTTSPPPANKRQRTVEPNQVTAEEATFEEPQFSPAATAALTPAVSEVVPTPDIAARVADQTPFTTNKRKYVEELLETPGQSTSATPDIAARAQETPYITEDTPMQESEDEDEPTPIPHTRPVKTPQSLRKHKDGSPKRFLCPSTHHREEPTSLSTITEYSEPSFFSHLSDIAASPTPSKPPRTQPAPSYQDLPHSTPKRPRAAPPARKPTPRRAPIGTPVMRRAAQLRAAREAEQTGATPNTSTTNNFSFSVTNAKAAPPKPKESNADARQAKLERIRALKKELEELENDEDVVEMQSHRRKRVKIDRLVSIPHNLPGDPSGTFRVPEGDSDDEMEVYDDVEERSNVFEDSERMVEVVATPPAKIPSPAIEVEDTPTITFNFPEIGPIPEDYSITEEEREQARIWFEQGYLEWLAAQ